MYIATAKLVHAERKAPSTIKFRNRIYEDKLEINRTSRLGCNLLGAAGEVRQIRRVIKVETTSNGKVRMLSQIRVETESRMYSIAQIPLGSSRHVSTRHAIPSPCILS